MITSLKKEINDKKSIYLNQELKTYVVDKLDITENPKRIWFKGCRFR